MSNAESKSGGERPALDSDEGKKLRLSNRTLNWTSAKAPATTVANGLKERLKGYGVLEGGIHVVKVSDRGVKKNRVITVSRDRYAIFITHQTLNRGGKGVLSKVAKTLPLPLVTRKGIVGFTNTTDMRERFVRYIDVADLNFVECGNIGTLRMESSRVKNHLKGADSWIDRSRDHVVTIGHHGHQTLDIIVPNATERQKLVECLKGMIDIYHELKQQVSNEALLLRYIWYDVDSDQNGLIGENEFQKILSRMNFQAKKSSKTYRDFVKKEGAGKEGLSYAQVMTLLQSMKNTEQGMPMANKIWNETFGSEANVVNAEDFLVKFLYGKQGETHVNIEQARALLSRVNGLEINVLSEPKNINASKEISRNRFEVLLHHSLNSAYDPQAVEVKTEVKLNEPISKYWISTSHNTYLTGDQLQSKSSVEMYMKAMRRGCKCLELDCWDGEKSSSGVYLPVVFHGHTLTSKILFADIIRCVKSYMNEVPNSYPMILSLENHCSHPFQRQMATDMKEILGSILYAPTPSEKDQEGDLPSPETLRGRVVIKGKRPPEPDDAVLEDETDREDDPYNAASPTDSPSKAGTAGEKGTQPAKPPKVVKELADLTLFHGAKFKNFAKSIEEPTANMHSIGETKIPKIVAKEASNSLMWRRYNVYHMTRTYPAGKRVDSSNYNPLLAWALGCQLVALNFQTSDTPLILNDGLFQQNGSCGYIRKPTTVLLESEETYPLPDPTINTTSVISATSGSEEPAELGTKVTPSKNKKDPLGLVMKTVGGAISGTSAVVTGAGSAVVGAGTALTKIVKSPVGGGNKTAKVKSTAQLESQGLTMPFRIGIRILSGSCLPKPYAAKSGEVIDPYVTVTLHDVSKHKDGSLEYTRDSLTTSTVQDNGFCPVWDEKEYEFVVHNPQVAIVNFALKESDIALDDKVANAAIPVSVLRKGYRSVQLFNLDGLRTGPYGCATLLVHINCSDLSESA